MRLPSIDPPVLATARRTMLASLLVVWTSPAPHANAGDNDGALTRDTVNALVDRIERLDTACKFRVEGTEWSLELDDSLVRTAPGELLLRAARAGAQAGLGARFGELEAAFSALSVEIAARQVDATRWRSFVARIASTPDVRVEECESPADAPALGQYRCAAFNLVSEQYHGRNLQLRALPPGGSPVLYDLRTLYQPLLVDPRSLQWLRRYEWRDLASVAGAAPRLVELHHPDSSDSFFRVEFDASSALPLDASFHIAADGGASESLALYDYGARAADASQSSLRTVLGMRVDDRFLCVNRYRVREIDFDVVPADLLLHVEHGTVLFDERTPETVFHGYATDDWPAEIASHLAFRAPRIEVTARVEPAGGSGRDETRVLAALPTSPLQLLGFALVVAGSAWLLRSRRASGRRA